VQFNFAQPEWLWLLALVPLYGLWHWWRSRSRAGSGLRFSSVASAREAGSSLTARLRGAPVLLRMGVFVLGVLALARPREQDTTREQFTEGIDIIMALDTSTSMRAQDFDPNRFEAARDVAAEFVRNRLSDRVGLIVFAANAYTQAPITLDYSFLMDMIREVEIGMIEDGTAIGTALAMATNRLKDTEAESRVIILLTDGQNNRGEVDPVTAAEVAETMGVRVYPIGVGTRGKAPFVVDSPFGGKQRRMMNVEINEEMLKEVANITGGRYFRATDKEALRKVYEEISELEKTKIQEKVYTNYTERYARFLWPALILALLDVLLSTTLLRRFP
jgi:Ca-activated chloride channel family protein